MGKDKINKTLIDLNENLKKNCCAKEVTLFDKKLKSNVTTHIKLYDKISDACEENDNYEWYLLDEICKLNCKLVRPNGIVCHNCEIEFDKKNTKCVISLIIDNSENTRFGRIDKLEIIY
ncbi:MAG: hypothetical protein PHC28_10555 [Flavobacterium sp.]|uniref:hypothetical protein n=1 Tax=Flavobacterium sp. TaxID=239 RepID=UPI00261381A6|nr:hypothetical protein [Flavobacterium sp.]MDD5150898.1 hypothetical protein [Flavobacterium sp.]